MSKLLDSLSSNSINDGLLREFIYKKLWKASLNQIDSLIINYEIKLQFLKTFKMAIEEEDANHIQKEENGREKH